MTLIDAIRTYRLVRGIPFEQARDLAIQYFVSHNLPLPEWAKKYVK